MLITYFIQNKGEKNNVSVYEIEDENIRVNDLVETFPLIPTENLHFRCKVYLGRERKRYGWMDLDPKSDMIVPKCNGCICLKLLQLRPVQSNPETENLSFKYKYSSVMDSVKQNAKMHLKSVVGSLSGFMSQLVSRPKEPPSMATRAQLRRLRQYSETAVSSKTHEKLLKRLWKALVPESSFKPKSSKWVDRMGFQNSNPISDFRGGGELALRSLVYAAEKHSKFMSSHDNLSSYPLCVGAINIVLMISRILCLSDDVIPETRYWTLFENPEAFFVIFFASLRLLDLQWKRENGTLSEFSRIMSRVEESVRSTLDSSPESLSSFERSLLLSR